MENEKKFKFIKGCDDCPWTILFDDCPFFCYDVNDEVYSCLIENKIFNKNKNKLFKTHGAFYYGK